MLSPAEKSGEPAGDRGRGLCQKNVHVSACGGASEGDGRNSDGPRKECTCLSLPEPPAGAAPLES